MRFLIGLGVVAASLLSACGGGGGGSSSNGGGSSDSGDSGGYEAGPGPQGGTALYSDFRSGKKLVLHQRDSLAVTPTTFSDRLATMESTLTAFDGVFLRLPQTSDAITRNATVDASTIAADLHPLYALRPTKLKYNFAVVTIQNDLDVFDDWSKVMANFGRLAKVARDAGLVGIVVDDESLSGLRVNYPYDLKNQTKTLEQYRVQTQAIAKTIMQSITTEFPDAVVIVLRGAAGAEPKSPPNIVNCESRDPATVNPNALCGANSAQLLGAFFAGFVEGNGARSLLVDGGTDYGLRTPEQFAASLAWRKTGLPSAETASAFIPEALRAPWSSRVGIAFGVRELDGAHGNLLPNDPGLWASAVTAGLRTTDTFVWASFDLTDMTKAAATQPFVVASGRAKTAAASPTAPLFSTAPATGTGLLAQYYAQIDESELAQSVVDAYIDNNWSLTGGPSNTVLSGQNDNFSVIWTGYVEAPTTGTYTFFGTTDDGMQIYVGNTLVVDAFYFQGTTEHPGTIDLVAGTRYPIKIRYFQGFGGTEAHVLWQAPGGDKEVIPTERTYPYK